MNTTLYLIGIAVALIGVLWAPISETCIGHEINVALSEYQPANDSQTATGFVAELISNGSGSHCSCRQEFHLALVAGGNT